MRETKTVVTPGGHSVVINAYLTGREVAEIDGTVKTYMRMGVDVNDRTPEGKPKTEIRDIPGNFIVEQETKALKFLVVSVDDVKENAYDLLLDLPSTEYLFVKDEVEKITNPTTPQNSAQPGSGTSEAA